MQRYDPFHAPDAAEWLAMDEGERMILVEEYHRRAGARLPNVRAHVIVHVIVESQAAMGDELPVRRTIDRLCADGLDRHDAVHAVASVLARHLTNLMAAKFEKQDPHAEYWAALGKLTAQGWRDEGRPPKSRRTTKS